MKKRILVVPIFGLIVAGCAPIGTSEFKCSAPSGVHCQSVTATYLSSLNKPIATSSPVDSEAAAKEARESDPKALADLPRYGKQTAPVLRTAAGGKMPLRTDPRLLRLWVKQWEDSDGDYHDQSYIYLPVDAGRWTVAHNRPANSKAYPNITPPSTAGQRGDYDLPKTAAEKVDPKEVTRSATDFAKSFIRPQQQEGN